MRKIVLKSLTVLCMGCFLFFNVSALMADPTDHKFVLKDDDGAGGGGCDCDQCVVKKKTLLCEIVLFSCRKSDVDECSKSHKGVSVSCAQATKC
jgi:hypothetical protein